MDDSYLNYSLDALKFLNSFYEKHHDKKGLEVFSVYTPVEDKEIPDAEILEVRNLIASNKIQFPVLVDEGFKTFRNYGIIALPSIIMVGKTGKIEFIYPSFPMSAQEVVSKQAKALIGLAPAEQKEAQVKKKEGEDSQARRLYRYSLQMYKKGLSEQALSALNKSLSLDPDYSWARNLKGIILFKRGNSQDSMEEFKRAIALDNNIAAHINLAIMLSEQDQYKESEGIIKSASYDRIDFKVRAHYLLGLSYRNMNKHDLAIRELELAENLFDVWASENEDSHFYTYSYRIPILRDLSELYSKEQWKGFRKQSI
jgi:tetratricopeptide (TPR) repeat protein